jgi:hypothetical protein
MAQRRNFQNMYDGYEGDPFDDGSGMIGGDFNPGGSPFEAPPAPTSPGGGFGSDFQDDPLSPGTSRAPGFFLLSPEEQQQIRDMERGAIVGNQETAREIGGWMKPNTPIERQNEPQLPQAVSVEERAGPEQSFSNDTPPQSFAPAPVSAGTPNPMETPVGPQRRSLSNAAPALFAESGGSRMFGDAGGLMSGGRGVLGSNAGGPTPTEMMLSIMRQLRGGA